MARYTDIDLLIDKVEGTDWYHISKQGELVRGANSKDDIPLYKHSDIKEVLNNAPVADVVPKSEVERLNKELDELAEELSDLIVEKDHLFDEVVRLRDTIDVYEETSGLKQAKREVAREIFEEIEREIKNHGICYAQRKIAELKKKYTEAKSDE